MDNLGIIDKSVFSLKSDGFDKSGILVIDGQNYASRDECEEGCDCLEQFISGKPDELDETDIWDEDDEREFEDILRRARESQVSGF